MSLRLEVTVSNEWKRRSRSRRVRMNRAPKHVFLWVYGGYFHAQPEESLLCLQPCKNRLPLGMMPILNRVAGIFPAGNQHFLMPFAADHAHRAGLNFSFQSVPVFYTGTDFILILYTVILFPFHISSPWHVALYLLNCKSTVQILRDNFLKPAFFNKLYIYYSWSHLHSCIYTQTHQFYNFY